MATIHNEIAIERNKEFVWDAIRDVGAIHKSWRGNSYTGSIHPIRGRGWRCESRRCEASHLDGSAVVIPAGTKHNIVNDSDTEELKRYTLYAPPEHRNGMIHRTKADALSHGMTT
jgi:quercetin dioxygenase-like cupin family protein